MKKRCCLEILLSNYFRGSRGQFSLTFKTKHNSIMVKGIVNAFDHMGFCLVLNLTTTCTDGKWAGIWAPILLPGMLVLLPTFTLGSKYLLLDKSLFLTLIHPFNLATKPPLRTR